MKKIFSLLLMAMAFVGSWAADETIVFSDKYSSNTTLDGDTIRGTDFSLVFQKRDGGTATQYYTNGSAVRWYGGGTLVVSSTTKTISQIEITYTQTANTVSTDVGTYSLNDNVGTWTGSASSITFTQSGTSGQCRISAIAVTYEGGSEPPTPTYQTIPYTESLLSSQGLFTIEDVSLGGLTEVWKTSPYGMTANGYNCTGDIESWFVSPLIDGTAVSAVNLTFEENLRFFADTEAATQEATLWVREGENGTWTQVTIPAAVHIEMGNNDFVPVGDIDLSAYAGKVFQIGFKYTATAAKPGRWEIKNLAITEGIVPDPEVATVAEFNALDQGTTFKFTGEGLVATVQKGSYLYAQDETGGILLYGTISPSYAKGDVIPAGFTATKSEYNGAAQATNLQDMEDAVDSQTVTAKEYVAADFTAATFAELSNFGIYGVVRGVTVNGNTLTLADGTTVVNTYTTFADVPASTSGKIYDVYGIMGWRNGIQFLPTEYVQTATTQHEVPTITVVPEQETYFVGDEVTVKFTSSETDVNIGYDIEDTETFPAAYRPLSNGDSITVTLNEPGVVNVRAFAYGYNEGDELGNSEVVTKTLTFVVKPEPSDQYELVTSADQIAAGNEYVLAYSNDTKTFAMGAAAAYGSNHVRVSVEAGSSEFTLEDGVITLMSATTVTPFTLETSETEGFYNIKIDGDQYIYWTSGNTVETGTTLGDVTVTLNDDGNAVIKYNTTGDRYLQYNASSPRFCFYSGTQMYPKLYVKVAAPAGKLGDANCDGNVDVSDVTTIINYILQKNPDPFSFANADVNGDGEVTVQDVTLIIEMILQNE